MERKIYDDIYRKHGAYHWAESLHNFARSDSIKSLISIDYSVSLDLGCGDGYILANAIHGSSEVKVGMDISIVALKYAKQRVTDTHFVLGDCRSSPFRSESFDMVLCAELIEHLEEKEHSTLLQEIYRTLRPKGTLILTTPNKETLSRILKPSMSKYHSKEYSMRELIEKLNNEKFSVAKIKGFYLNTGSMRLNSFLLNRYTSKYLLKIWKFLSENSPTLAGYLFVKAIPIK